MLIECDMYKSMFNEKINLIWIRFLLDFHECEWQQNVSELGSKEGTVALQFGGAMLSFQALYAASLQPQAMPA